MLTALTKPSDEHIDKDMCSFWFPSYVNCLNQTL